MKIAATLSFILHLFFIPSILLLFLDVRTYPTHTRMISVSLHPMESEKSAPARKGGEAIPFWVNIPIKFYLQ
jgi:hypothetical protein